MKKHKEFSQRVTYYVGRNTLELEYLKFNDNDVLKNVYIKDYEDVPVSNIKIPENTKALGIRFCKGNKSLMNVTLNNDLRILKNECFCDCTILRSIVIPYGVTQIKRRCFYNCINLETITIPFSLKKISSLSFCHTSLYKIKLIEKNRTNTFDCSVPLFIKHLIEKNNVYCPNYYLDKEDLIRKKIELCNDLVIPEGIVKMGRECLKNKKITTITLPKSLKEIGRFSFKGSDLKKVIINSNVIINFNAFILCNKLEEIKINSDNYSVKYNKDHYYYRKENKIINCCDKRLYNDYYYNTFSNKMINLID